MAERLFDIVAQRCDDDPTAPMLAAKEEGQWRTYTVNDIWSTARKLAGGINGLRLKSDLSSPEAQEKIAIISPNRPEWIITDLAVQLTGAVLTPVYPTIKLEELVFVLNEAEIQMVFIANEQIYGRVMEIFDQVPSLKHIYTFDKIDAAKNWQELVDKNLQPDEDIIKKIATHTLATIIYTSGTTGKPKGVMLSHQNILNSVQDSLLEFTFTRKGDTALSFLPLNHIFERMFTYVYIKSNVAIYYAESMDTIGANLKEVKPMFFTTVPRLLEKVYERIISAGLELKGVKRVLFFWALNLAKRYDNIDTCGIWYSIQLTIADRLVFSKWRQALGGNLRALLTGAAACQPMLIRIFTAARIIIMEGYGLTETSAVVSINKYGHKDRRIGTVGIPLAHTEVKIADGDEILARGPGIMMGYYKQPGLTAEVLRDNWLYTGDIGEWSEGRFLRITGRKKEIFKTSGGRYVAPQPIENKMKESIFIEQLIVLGNNRNFVSALIVPNMLNLLQHLHNHYPLLSIPSRNEDILTLPESIALIQRQIDMYNPLFNRHEQIKKFTLLPVEWTIDTGELTPSLKIKRDVIQEKYATEFNKMYA
jgi:long-chain acyl-CoA synthetase